MKNRRTRRETKKIAIYSRRLQVYAVRWVATKELQGIYVSSSVQDLGDELDGVYAHPDEFEFGRVNVDEPFQLFVENEHMGRIMEDDPIEWDNRTLWDYRKEHLVKSVKAWFSFGTHWKCSF